MRQNGDLGLDARLPGGTDDGEHTADGMVSRRRVLDDLDTHDVAGLGPRLMAARDQHLRLRPALLDHEIDAALAAQRADDLTAAALEDLDDMTFQASAPRIRHADGDAIVSPQRMHLAGGEIHVLAPVVAPQKTIAVPVSDYRARDEIEMARQAILVGAIAQQLAVAHHRLEPVLQRTLPLLGLQSETCAQPLEG